jgi:YHS domain-containing protein
MQKRQFLVLTLAFLLIVTGSVLAQETAKPCPGQSAAKPCPGHTAANPCPGQKATGCCKGESGKQVSLDYKGKRLYFCCDANVETFKKDPEKHLKEMEALGLTFDASYKPQEKCPVMGGEIKKDLKVEYAGMYIYACCPGCLDKIKAEPAKMVKAMQANGESPILCVGGCGSAPASGRPCSTTCTKPCGKEGTKTTTEVKEKALESTS